MQLALLGYDEDALRLVTWAVESRQHELVSAYCAASAADELRKLQPTIKLSDDWEELLLGSTADAVIVARGICGTSFVPGSDLRELRADQLRKLAQAAVPMIVVCPACEAIVGFEIDMIRRDTDGLIIPYVPLGLHPLIDLISQWLLPEAESPIGNVEQIVFEREQADRRRDAVLLRLARDVSLIRELIGTIQSVGASSSLTAVGRDPLGPKPKEPPSLANLSVHFGGQGSRSARWSISPAADSEMGRLIVIGQQGKAVLTMPASGDWQLSIPGHESLSEPAYLDDDAAHVFSWLTHALENREFYDPDSWLAACRDQEAVEAVDRSLMRGRTIELFNEEHTEEASFKGVMAMGGCLILVGALAVVLFAAVVEGLHLPMRNWPVWRLWPFYVLAPIAVFLLLQLLSLALKRNDARSTPTLPVS
jgi:hypothetical protein